MHSYSKGGLRGFARDHGLSVTGSKAALATRLHGAWAEHTTAVLRNGAWQLGPRRRA